MTITVTVGATAITNNDAYNLSLFQTSNLTLIEHIMLYEYQYDKPKISFQVEEDGEEATCGDRNDCLGLQES
jgi:hypothetical protein